MSGESNGHEKSRLDRLEGLMELLIDEHLKFTEEHKFLLRAQVILTESQERTGQQIRELAEAQKHTDERLNALINIVDGLIRKRPDA